MTESNNDCIFCSIVAGTTPADVVFDGGDTLFFRDINPKAPVHAVGIPKVHITSLDVLTGDEHALVGKILHEAADVARDLGVSESGYRVITNVGKDAGQEIEHLHFHVIGGEPLGPLRS
ncbi:MAG: histidine triad nucleotide-binding protein [Candidatus Andersenbacteria bacterium]|nr:histidine triad nucleotide-binding protein [Candidatus Andersenbacteria bacterium]MBI3251018.1 histidine triad nucleotide-binding protein [Candidatus Andersenbacteria bacterium]